MHDENEIQEDDNVLAEDVFIFENGLYGFEYLRRFIFINKSENSDNPFKLMISLEDPQISFIVVPPFEIYKEYDIEIDDIELNKIGANNPCNIIILSIVTLSKSSISLNLKSPIILSLATNKGKQIILDDDRYDTKYIVDVIKK